MPDQPLAYSSAQVSAVSASGTSHQQPAEITAQVPAPSSSGLSDQPSVGLPAELSFEELSRLVAQMQIEREQEKLEREQEKLERDQMGKENASLTKDVTSEKHTDTTTDIKFVSSYQPRKVFRLNGPFTIQHFENNYAVPITDEALQQNILSKFDLSPVVYLHGPRQAGKTTIAYAISERFGFHYKTLESVGEDSLLEIIKKPFLEKVINIFWMNLIWCLIAAQNCGTIYCTPFEAGSRNLSAIVGNSF